jgi:hypothetical protein
MVHLRYSRCEGGQLILRYRLRTIFSNCPRTHRRRLFVSIHVLPVHLVVPTIESHFFNVSLSAGFLGCLWSENTESSFRRYCSTSAEDAQLISYTLPVGCAIFVKGNRRAAKASSPKKCGPFDVAVSLNAFLLIPYKFTVYHKWHGSS